ncbi:MAG: hypothetical protein ACRCUE_14710 [Bosea sp. (in: a-proteobacteria)]
MALTSATGTLIRLPLVVWAAVGPTEPTAAASICAPAPFAFRHAERENAKRHADAMRPAALQSAPVTAIDRPFAFTRGKFSPNTHNYSLTLSDHGLLTLMNPEALRQLGKRAVQANASPGSTAD